MGSLECGILNVHSAEGQWVQSLLQIYSVHCYLLLSSFFLSVSKVHSLPKVGSSLPLHPLTLKSAKRLLCLGAIGQVKVKRS